MSTTVLVPANMFTTQIAEPTVYVRHNDEWDGICFDQVVSDERLTLADVASLFTAQQKEDEWVDKVYFAVNSEFVQGVEPGKVAVFSYGMRGLRYLGKWNSLAEGVLLSDDLRQNATFLIGGMEVELNALREEAFDGRRLEYILDDAVSGIEDYRPIPVEGGEYALFGLNERGEFVFSHQRDSQPDRLVQAWNAPIPEVEFYTVTDPSVTVRVEM